MTGMDALLSTFISVPIGTSSGEASSTSPTAATFSSGTRKPTRVSMMSQGLNASDRWGVGVVKAAGEATLAGAVPAPVVTGVTAAVDDAGVGAATGAQGCLRRCSFMASMRATSSTRVSFSDSMSGTLMSCSAAGTDIVGFAPMDGDLRSANTRFRPLVCTPTLCREHAVTVTHMPAV